MTSDETATSETPASETPRVRGVIFDGDDTLWLTETLYDDARRRVRAVAEQAGLNGAEWERVQRLRDVANVAEFGHSTVRFPTSCVEALLAVGGDLLPESAQWVERVRVEAATVFTTPAPLREGAADVLMELARRGVRLALLTKGDPLVQRWRVGSSGLERWFDIVSIVDRKVAESFADVAAALGLGADQVISVGNSVESDVLPSTATGIRALWLPAHVWDYERRHDPAVELSLCRIGSLLDVLDLVEESGF